MVTGSKTAIAILAGFIWIFSVKTAVALPFSGMEGPKGPVQTEHVSPSAFPNPVFLGPHPISPKAAQGSMARSGRGMDFSIISPHFSEYGDKQAGKAAFREEYGPSDASTGRRTGKAVPFLDQWRSGLLVDVRGMGDQPQMDVSEFDVSVTDGLFQPETTNSIANLAQKPLLSGVLGPEVGMACSNPLTGPGPRNPATFTLMTAGFVGMAAGRFLIARF